VQHRMLPTSISLERTTCFGSCPAYKVTLTSSGKVAYEGKMYVTRKGKYTSQIKPEEFKKLAAIADAAGFYDLKRSYESATTDLPTAITQIARSGKVFEVSNYGSNGPDGLRKLEESIDRAVAKAVNWKPVKSR